MNAHEKPRRRSRDSRWSSRSHSADEPYASKPRTASPRVPVSTIHAGSDISSIELPPLHFAPPEDRLSATKSPAWRPGFRPDHTNVKHVSKWEDDEWLPHLNVCPNIRQLAREGFQFNPGCLHLRRRYLTWLEANDQDPQPYAIEILAKSTHPKHVQFAPTKNAPSEVPHAIRMNSKPILNFLASLFDTKGQQWIKRSQSMIISFPFKILIHYDSAIRNRCNELQQLLDLLNKQLAQHSIEPKQHYSSESSMEDVPGVLFSEQSSLIMASNVTSTEPESDLGHLEDDSAKRSNIERGEKGVQHDIDDISELKAQTSVDLEHFHCIVAFMDQSIKPHFESYRNGVYEKLRFLDLWSLFQPGDYILWNEHSHPLRKRPRNTDYSLHCQSSWESREKSPELWKVFATSSESYFQPYESPCEFNLTAFRIHFDGTSFGPVSFTFSVPQFEGEKKVKSLEVVPLRYFEDSEHLLREHLGKGQKFLSYALSSPSFWGYKGHTARFFHDHCPNFMADEKEVDSRVIVDFREAHSDGAGLAHSMPELSVSVRTRRLFDLMGKNNCSECHDFPDDQTVDEAISKMFQQSDAFLSRYAKSELYTSDHEDFLGDPELRIFPGCVPAWILSDGKWGHVRVTELRPVAVDGALWSELRLRKGQKEAMLSLAQSHFQKKNMDIKKSTYTNSECGGVRILLTGPDGVGKTFAAKSLASVLCKPLYRIMADSLGKNRAEISTNLHQTFARAERWDCVLLLEDVEAVLLRLRRFRAVESKTSALFP